MEKNSYTVLIVDDEQIEREAIRMILETSHLPISFIYEANSGRKMLEMTASHSVDIIILDINMPGLSGLQALEMLRSEGRDTKVIISTAYDEFNFAVKALQSGAVDFLVKPVDDETLIESLRKSIERLDEEKAKEAKISRIEAYLRISSSSLALSDEDANSVLVKQVCSYIESNYDKRIGLDEIAADCSYSKFHMARIFKSVMNMTVIDYLTKVRMEKAKELLAITKDSVKVIAFRTGYSDPNYFSLTFRKYEGITPLQYRAKALSAKR